MFESTGNHFKGVDWMVPDIVLIVSFNWTSIFFVWALLSQTGLQYSATGNTRASAVVLRVDAVGPQLVPVSLCRMLLRVLILADVFLRCSL